MDAAKIPIEKTTAPNKNPSTEPAAPLKQQVEKLIGQVRETISNFANLQDLRLPKETLQRLKPLIEEILRTVSLDDMNSAKDKQKTIARFVPNPKTEKKTIPFPQTETRQPSPQKIDRRTVVSEKTSPEPLLPKKEKMPQELPSRKEETRLEEKHPPIREEIQKKPLAPIRKEVSISYPNDSQPVAKEEFVKNREVRVIPAAPFTSQSSPQSHKKKKKKQKRFWFPEEESTDDRPPF